MDIRKCVIKVLNRVSCASAIITWALLATVACISAPLCAQEMPSVVSKGELEVAETRTLELGINEEKVLKIPCMKVHIVNPEIADVKLRQEESEIWIYGKSEGQTDLDLWTRDGKLIKYVIRVSSIAQLKRKLKKLLDPIVGITVSEVEDIVRVEGKILRMEDIVRFNRIYNHFADDKRIIWLVDIPPPHPDIVKMILKDLKTRGFFNVAIEIRAIGEKQFAVLAGKVFGDELKEQAAEIVRMHGFENVLNHLQVDPPMVEIDVQVATIDKEKFRGIGDNALFNSIRATIGRPMEIQTGPDAGITQYPSIVIGEGIQTRLYALHTRGETASYIAQHQSVTSGNEAEFIYGGEMVFVIPGAGEGEGRIQSKEYGLIVQVTPVVDVSGIIAQDISVENSMPVGRPITSAGSMIVELQKFRSSTHARCATAESILLSGISQSGYATYTERTPILGQVPILKYFFSHKEQRKFQNYVLIVVTPTVPTIRDNPEYLAFSKKQAWVLEEAKAKSERAVPFIDEKNQ